MQVFAGKVAMNVKGPTEVNFEHLARSARELVHSEIAQETHALYSKKVARFLRLTVYIGRRRRHNSVSE